MRLLAVLLARPTCPDDSPSVDPTLNIDVPSSFALFFVLVSSWMKLVVVGVAVYLPRMKVSQQQPTRMMTSTGLGYEEGRRFPINFGKYIQLLQVRMERDKEVGCKMMAGR